LIAMPLKTERTTRTLQSLTAQTPIHKYRFQEPMTETGAQEMTRATKLTRRQQAVIDDLFNGELDEQAVLQKHNVTHALYNRWLADERFAEQFERRITQAYRSGRIVLARYATAAAVKLIELTDCKKEETARKACLDIITLDCPTQGNVGPTTPAAVEATPSDSELPPETASRILAALAQPPQQADVTPARPPSTQH
jgi:hypothetical protein